MQKKIYQFIFPAITLLCVLPVVFFPQVFGFLFLPISLAASLFYAMSIALNKSPVLPLATVFLFLLFLLYTHSAAQSLLYMMMFLPVGVCVGVGYRKKYRLGQTSIIALLVALFMLLLICVTYILEVSPIFSVKDALEPFRKMVSSIADEVYAQLALYPSVNAVGMMDQLLSMTRESFANTLYINIVYTAPVVISVIVLIINGASYFIMKRIFIHTNNEVSFMSSFDTLRVSKTSAGLYMISVILSAFLSLTSDNTAVYLVCYIFSTVLSFALAVCGLSVVWYFLKSRDFGKAVRIILFMFIIFVCVVITVLPSLLAFLAVIDTMTDVRARIDGRFGV